LEKGLGNDFSEDKQKRRKDENRVDFPLFAKERDEEGSD
jgi:hypothetical protein